MVYYGIMSQMDLKEFNKLVVKDVSSESDDQTAPNEEDNDENSLTEDFNKLSR